MKTTVIVPVYNVELYLAECLSSLVLQTDRFDEIIVVNDGSTDRSGEICEKYSREYPYIRLISQKNQGQGAARNRGIEAAHGDYIVFVDSDDYVSRDLNRRLKEQLECRMPEVLFYNADIQEDIPSRERREMFRHKQELDGSFMDGMEYFRRSFPLNYSVSIYMAAYKKSFLRKNHIMFPEGIFYEDNYFSLQVISSAERVFCIPDCLYVRRCLQNSVMTGEMTEKKCRDRVMSQELMWKYLVSRSKWLDQKELLKRNIALEVLRIFYDLSLYPDRLVVAGLRQKVVELFAEYWMPLFREGQLSWDVGLAFLLILKELRREREGRGGFSIDYEPGTEKEIFSLCEQIRQDMRRRILDRLHTVPLAQYGKKVGIYGIGYHTSVLMEFYRREAGEVQAEIFFIVSSCGTDSEFLGKPVIGCGKIPKDIDCIIISSYRYQQEMCRKLMEQGVGREKIVRLYDETELCGVEMADWVMRY